MNINITQEHLDLVLEILQNERETINHVITEGYVDNEEVEELKERAEMVSDLASCFAYELDVTTE